MPSGPHEGHRRSLRLRGYDYSRAGAYFITICESNRECIFAEVVRGEVHSNQIGAVVLKWWNELPNYYPRVELDEFVVMPNHIHAIIVITDGPALEPFAPFVGAGLSRPASRAPCNKLTLGQVIGYFKFQITKEINEIRGTGYAKIFQRNYYEHIIRNEREWNAIAE